MKNKTMKYFVGGVLATAVGVTIGLYIFEKRKRMFIQTGQYVYEHDDGNIYVLEINQDNSVTLWENDEDVLDGSIKYDIRDDVYLFVTEERNIEIKTNGEELLIPIVTDNAILAGVFTKEMDVPLLIDEE